MRVALGVEYDGRLFSGWETQKDRDTVQSSLEGALSRIADEPVKTVCAGRTDSGVHAWGQVVHFDTSRDRPLRAWVLGTNNELPGSVSVAWAHSVPEDFHARFSAISRRYCYLLLNRPSRSGIYHRRVGWESRALSLDAMRQAATHLVGEHDFSAFRAAGCQARSPVRTIRELRLTRRDEIIVFDVTANAFLQHMVRNLVGSLLLVGLGRRPPEWIGALLAGGERRLGGPAMTPSGLYLAAVAYPSRFQLPASCPPVLP